MHECMNECVSVRVYECKSVSVGVSRGVECVWIVKVWHSRGCDENEKYCT